MEVREPSLSAGRTGASLRDQSIMTALSSEVVSVTESFSFICSEDLLRVDALQGVTRNTHAVYGQSLEALGGVYEIPRPTPFSFSPQCAVGMCSDYRGQIHYLVV